MAATSEPSEFRFEKQRVNATISTSSGPPASGCFFTAGASSHHSGPERVGELLNGATGFFPF